MPSNIKNIADVIQITAADKDDVKPADLQKYAKEIKDRFKNAIEKINDIIRGGGTIDKIFKDNKDDYDAIGRELLLLEDGWKKVFEDFKV